MITSVSVVHPESPPEVRRKHEQVQENRQKVSKVLSVNPSPHFPNRSTSCTASTPSGGAQDPPLSLPPPPPPPPPPGPSSWRPSPPSASMSTTREGSSSGSRSRCTTYSRYCWSRVRCGRVGSKVMKTLPKLFCFPGRNSASPSCAGSLPLMATTTTTMKISRTTL